MKTHTNETNNYKFSTVNSHRKSCFLRLLLLALSTLYISIFFAQTYNDYDSLSSSETTQPQRPPNYEDHDAGTETNPYQINTIANLRWLSEEPDDWYVDSGTQVHFLQTAEIDATETVIWNEGKGFRPIGYREYQWSQGEFIGVYDGCGYSIKNLFISPPYKSAKILGMFVRVYDSTIKNVHLENITITGESDFDFSVGAIAGAAIDSYIENSSSSGLIDVVSNYEGRMLDMDVNAVGGIVGWAYYSTTIANCSSTGSIIVNSIDLMAFAGGIAGRLWGEGVTVTASFSTGDIYSKNETINAAGGIAGQTHYAFISNSYSSGNINGDNAAGGLVGLFWSSELENSYSTANVHSSFSFGRVGGIAGSMSMSSIINCYSIGLLSSPNDSIGRIAGRADDSNISYSFWNREIAGVSEAIGDSFDNAIIANLGLSTYQMKQATTYTAFGWNFDETWDITSAFNDGYPYLRATHYGAPSNLTSVVDAHTVYLTWREPANHPTILKNYLVYGDETLLFSTTELGYIDTPVQLGEYIYSVKAVYASGESMPAEIKVIVEYVADDDKPIKVDKTALIGNYPNPFNPSTTISFTVSTKSIVTIEIFNIRGQRIRTLVDDVIDSGNHSVVWNGHDENGQQVSSGVYFYRMCTIEDVMMKRMLLVK